MVFNNCSSLQFSTSVIITGGQYQLWSAIGVYQQQSLTACCSISYASMTHMGLYSLFKHCSSFNSVLDQWLIAWIKHFMIKINVLSLSNTSALVVVIKQYFSCQMLLSAVLIALGFYSMFFSGMGPIVIHLHYFYKTLQQQYISTSLMILFFTAVILSCFIHKEINFQQYHSFRLDYSNIAQQQAVAV